MPTAIQELGEGDYWPHGDDAQSLLNHLSKLEHGANGQPSLYVDIPKLLVYVNDELAKIKRLIEPNEDYRSALLRAVGLWEVLMRARTLILIKTNKMVVAEKPTHGSQPTFCLWNEAPQNIKDWQPKMIETIIEHSFVYHFIAALCHKDNGTADERKSMRLKFRTNSNKKSFYYIVALRRLF